MSIQITKKILMMTTVGLIALSIGSALAQQVQPSNVDSAQIADAMAQTAGSFDTINMGYITSLGMQQKAWNDPMQHLGEGQTKPGYTRYVWTPDVILPLRLREGMMTMINLPAWELIEKVHIGSPESFGGEIAAPNSLLLYADPTYIGVDSNLIIFGRSGNRYVFYLRSETYNTDRITNAVVDIMVGPKYTPAANGGTLNISGGASATASGMGSIGGGAPGWSGAGGSSLVAGGRQNPNIGLNTAGNAPKNWLESIPMNPESLRFDIDVFIPNPEDIEIAPERVWRDEIFTYIDFGPKALTMTQRPIANLLVQGTEVPVGSRTRGPYSRLLIVEGIGDITLRNGQRVVCLKLRRDPAAGLENTDYSGSKDRTWYADQPSGTGASMGQPTNPYDSEMDVTYNWDVEANMQPMPRNVLSSQKAGSGIRDVMTGFGSAPAGRLMNGSVDNIAIELASGPNIKELEDRWEQIRAKNKDVLGKYNPYFSIDTMAEGGVPELFRLRVGPVENVKTGDTVCNKLAAKGISCAVIRTQ